MQQMHTDAGSCVVLVHYEIMLINYCAKTAFFVQLDQKKVLSIISEDQSKQNTSNLRRLFQFYNFKLFPADKIASS
jgi:hypothetical protein